MIVFSSLYLLLSVLVRGQDRSWTRMYGFSTGTGEYGRAVVTDNTGSVYMTGQVGGSLHGEAYTQWADIFTMKFASNGTRIWTRMAGSSTGNDAGNAIAVDNSASAIYVSGEASGSLHGETFVGSIDIFLMKYSSNGTRIWTKMAGSSTGERVWSMAVDSTGLVYVTGVTGSSFLGQSYNGGSSDFFLLKYSGNGTMIWAKLGGSSGFEVSYGITIDNTNCVYISGYTTASMYGETLIGGTDIFVAKYSGNGTRIWTKLIGSTADDAAFSIAVDTVSSAFYVAGYVGASLHGQTYVGGTADMVLMKFSTNGTRVWTKIQGTVNYDQFYSVAVDSTGAVFLAGSASDALDGQILSPNSRGVVLIKYSGNGTRVWTRMIGGADGYGVALYTLDAAYLTGGAYLSIDGQPYTSNDDIFLSKYTNNQPPTQMPTAQPTVQPTPAPTRLPTGQPSSQPSSQPIVQPSGQPSSHPSSQPSSQPTLRPSDQPSSQPTMPPSGQPTVQPSCQPSSQPSSYPSSQPTVQPSIQPSSQPSSQPSGQPLGHPSSQPSGQPTVQPSIQPSSQPTVQPSSQPSSQPTVQPSGQPTIQPSQQPSGQPTTLPTSQPSSLPTMQPSGQPTMQPSRQPTAQPTSQPSLQPSAYPSVQPTGQPSTLPSVQPTCQPSQQPAGDPSSLPTGQPSALPSGQPNAQPSSFPTAQPSSQPTSQPSVDPTAAPSAVPYETVCRYYTFSVVSNGARFSDYRCFRVRGVPGTHRKLAATAAYRDKLCSKFFVSHTENASNADSDYSCTFTACPGDHVRVSTLTADGGFCRGIPVLRLVEGYGPMELNLAATLVVSDAGHGGSCPAFEHVFGDSGECKEFAVVQGCHDLTACAGQTAIRFLPNY